MQIMEGPFVEEKKKNEGERTYLKSHLARRVTFSSVHPSSMVVSEQDRPRQIIKSKRKLELVVRQVMEWEQKHEVAMYLDR